MASLAMRNLFQDKIRLTITLTGVVFAVVLVAIQGGLFLGFRKATSDIIDHYHSPSLAGCLRQRISW